MTLSADGTKLILPSGKVITPSYVVQYNEVKDHSLPRFCTRDIYGIELSLP